MQVGLPPEGTSSAPMETRGLSSEDRGPHTGEIQRVSGGGMQYAIRAEGISKAFAGRVVLRSVSLVAKKGEFVCLLGPSGCGKTTLLNCLAGLETFSGRVRYGDEEIDAFRDKLGVVFQDYALFPWLTVRANVAFGVERRVADREERIDGVVRLVGLHAFRNYYPRQLSGGMKQRVAIARCLVREPEFLLMDEPFAALDALTREGMQDELLAIWERLGPGIVFVTHSIPEAVKLADRIVLMREGQIVEEIALQSGRPRDPGDREALFVARHIREMMRR